MISFIAYINKTVFLCYICTLFSFNFTVFISTKSPRHIYRIYLLECLMNSFSSFIFVWMISKTCKGTTAL